MDKTDDRGLADLIGPDRGWIAGQFSLFIAAAVAPPIETLSAGQSVTLGHPAVNVASGLALIVGGMAIVGRARADLAENFQMSPTPRAAGRLVDSGIYSHVRHPMYLAVILQMLGWSVAWGALSGYALTLAGVGFFTLKSTHEEGKLVEHYPQYPAYRRRVRSRFIPRVW